MQDVLTYSFHIEGGHSFLIGSLQVEMRHMCNSRLESASPCGNNMRVCGRLQCRSCTILHDLMQEQGPQDAET